MMWKIRWTWFMLGNLWNIVILYPRSTSNYRTNLELFRFRLDALRKGERPIDNPDSDFNWGK